MSKMDFQKNITTGSHTYDYRKTGVGAFPSEPRTVAVWTPLTCVGDRMVAIAGLNNKICGFFRLYDPGADKVSAWDESCGEISGIPATGTIAKGANVVGDTLTGHAGKVKEATPTYATPGTPTVQELKTAIEIVQNAKWVCVRSSSGTCTLAPSP